MSNHDQDPSYLSRKYARRARVASWAAGFLPIGAGVAAIEAATAQPAAATIEHVSNHEALSPSAFMASLDKRANVLTPAVMRSKNLQKVPGKDKTLNKAIELSSPGCEYLSIYMPDPDTKGLYNTLAILYNVKLKKVVEISISDGLNVPRFQDKVLAKESGPSMKFMHNDNNLKYESTGITITNEDKATNQPETLGDFYSVGSGYYSSPSFHQVNYELNPKAVVDQANKFFAAAEVIVDYNK